MPDVKLAWSHCRLPLKAVDAPLWPTTTSQHAFILGEIFILTLAGTAQRSRLYKSGTTEKDRKPFQDSLRDLLDELAKSYAVPVADETHVQNIARIADELSTKHKDVLAEDGLRIGHAQKALNLYLKYLWCLGEIPEPPHCPLDAIVLGKVPGCETVRWTRMKAIDEYRDVIAKAKIAAAGKSLAQWELAMWHKQGIKRQTSEAVLRA